MKQDTSWGEVSDWYDELLETDSDSYQAKVILPNILRIVAPASGVTVFDAACGQGFFSRAFATEGANVVASDISKELIGRAQEREDKEVANKGHHKHSLREPIEYHVSPAEKAEFLSDKSVDVQTIVLAIQNIRAIDPVFAEAARVLNDNGRLVFVMNHPAFRIPKASGWGFDEKSGSKGATQYRRIDAYMSESSSEIIMNPGKVAQTQGQAAQSQAQGRTDAALKTVSFHRPLQVYIKALTKAGFVVSRLEEWISHKKSEAGPRQQAEDTARKEIPLFLCIEARKKLQ